MYGKSFSYYVMHSGEEGFIKLTASRYGEDGWEHLTEHVDFPFVLGNNTDIIEEMTTTIMSAFIQQKATPFYQGTIGPNDGEYAFPA